MDENRTKEYQSNWWIDRAERFWSDSNKNEQAAKEALAYLENAINIDPLNNRAWADKGFMLKQLGDFESALLCFDRSLALNREAISPWYNKAVLLGLMGKFEEALKCYDRVLENDPKHELALRDRTVLMDVLNTADDI
jgi:tetratricopeptide (TPR) repeat protein